MDVIFMWTHNSNELYHFGIKGMKWGVRRTQKRQDQLDVKEATRHNKKQYSDSVRKANKKYNSQVDDYNYESDRAIDKYQTEIKRNRKEREHTITDTTNFFGPDSQVTAIKTKWAIKEEAEKNLEAESIRDKSLETLKMSYKDLLSQAGSERSQSIRNARELYDRNKYEIASGNSQTILKGRKALGM